MTHTLDDFQSVFKREGFVQCIYPWVSLDERSLHGEFKVCCWINQALGTHAKTDSCDLMELWRNGPITRIRQRMVDGSLKGMCPSNCPILCHEHDPCHHGFYEYDPSEYDSFSREFRENREAVLSAILNKEVSPNTLPLRLKLLPSNTCNLRCRMCNVDKTLKVPVGRDYFEKVYRLMPYLEELKIFGGEPFACKVTKEIVFGEEIRRYPQLHFSTVTNGTLLDEAMVQKLDPLRLGWFEFSLDACTEDTYHQIRLNASYSTTLRNVERFVRKRDRGEIRIDRVFVGFVIQDRNRHEIRKFVDFANDLGVAPAFSLVAGSCELLDKLDEVRGAVQEGLARARDRGDSYGVNSLLRVLNDLPGYEATLKRQRTWFQLVNLLGRGRVVSFLQRHTRLKRRLRGILRI